MINTIFYYPQTLTFEEYLNQLGSEIAARTIVFAKDQKSIYMGGKKFGASSASDISDLKQYIENILDDSSITNKIEEIISNYYNTTPQDLPTASTTKKGCIKVGSGLVMDNNEKLNVDFSSLPSGQNGIDGLDGLVELIIRTDTSARASYTNFGVVRVGSGITCESGVISVELTKGDKGDKGDTGAKGDKGDTGDRGPAGPSYDDSELRQLVQGNIDRLLTLINQFDQKVQDQVEEMLDDVDWMRENWPSGSGSTSNFGQQDVESYLQTIGVWEENEAHTKLNAKWSKITQDVSSITARVSALELNSGSGGTSSGSALTAEQILLIEKIDDLETAVAGLSTSYADFELDENKQLEIIRWLSSALNLYTNANATWTDLASAAHDTSVGLSAISDLNTRVTALRSDLDTLQTEGLEASANLSTLVGDEIDRQIASSGFVSTSALNTALAEYTTTAGMYTYVGEQVGPVNTKASNALAGLEACAKKVDGKLESSVSVWGDKISLSSGHKLTISSADEISIAAATLNAILGNATIKANQVNWNVSGYNIDADKINLSASHKLSISSASDLDISAATLNAILGNATISADNIDFSANDGSFAIKAFRLWNGTGVEPDEANEAGMTMSTGGSFRFYGSYYNFDSNSDTGTFNVACERTYIGNNEHSDLVQLGNIESELDIKLLTDGYITVKADTTTIDGDVSMLSGSLSVSDNIVSDNDIIAEGNMTADNLTIRNNGLITVGNSGSITTPSITSKSITIKDFNGSSEYGVITYEASPDHQIAFDSGINVGFDSDVNGSLSVTGTIYCSNGVQSSDERIKENIVELNPNIEDIAATRIVTFNFKEQEERNLGSIAQDWQAIFPEAVKEHDGVLGLDYNGISIASAVTAAREIVELKKKNAELEARLAALEAKLG